MTCDCGKTTGVIEVYEVNIVTMEETCIQVVEVDTSVPIQVGGGGGGDVDLLTSRPSDDTVVEGHVLTANDSGRWALADPDYSSGLWEVVAVSTEAAASGSTVAAETLHGRTVAMKFTSAPAVSSNGDRAFLSSTPGEAALSPTLLSGLKIIELGLVVGADGLSDVVNVVFHPRAITMIP